MDIDGLRCATPTGPNPGRGGVELHLVPMAGVALATMALITGVFLSLLYFWVGTHRELYRAEPAQRMGSALERCAMSELQMTTPPIGCGLAAQGPQPW